MFGEAIAVELSSADVTTAAPLAIRQDGAATARSLGPRERVSLTYLVVFVADAAAMVTIFSDVDGDSSVDALERMVEVGPGTHTISFGAGIAGAAGIIPRVIASGAGQVSVTGIGFVQGS